MSQTESKQEKVARVLALLEESRGQCQWKRDGTCLDVLVASMLSQNTQYANAESGYRQLRRRFKSWTEVMNADVREVQRQIAVCGLARMRARRLQALLRTIKLEYGRLNLEHLSDAKPRAAYEYLLSFFGIGPKTAACTLLFAFNMPVFPVDNGIRRMLRRLRVVRPKARDAECSEVVSGLAPQGQCYPLHVLMFDHAKETCRPRNPKCNECRLVELCSYGQRRLKHRPPVGEQPRRMRPLILSRFVSDGICKSVIADSEDPLIAHRDRA